MAIDPSKMTYREFVKFAFDHPVTDPQWYFDDAWEYEVAEPSTVLGYLTQLFRDPSSLLEEYDRDQLEQGFWFVPSACGFHDLLWDKAVPWPVRRECIHAMADLFEKLFAKDPLDTSSWMWWDQLADQYGMMQNGVPVDEDDAMIQDAMFKALADILRIDSRTCQRSALHGLGHLRHRDAAKAVAEFLESHPDVDDELRRYAMVSKAGDVL